MQIRKLSPFGAEVFDLDPACEFDEEAARELREAFDRHGLLLFRDVTLDADQHDRLVCILANDGRNMGRGPQPTYVSNREPDAIAPFGRLPFHTDLIWGEYPFRVVSLFAVDVEPPVVPTIFVNVADAWDSLPAGLKARATGRCAVQASGQHAKGADIVQLHHIHSHSRTTPIGFQHPRNGRTLLLIDEQSTIAVENLPQDESDSLLDDLKAHMYRPEALWTHEWRGGDLVVWDNLAVQHARANIKLDGAARTLRRATSGAPVPKGAAAIKYS